MKIKLFNDSINLYWENDEEKAKIIKNLEPCIDKGTEVELWMHGFHIKGEIGND